MKFCRICGRAFIPDDEHQDTCPDCLRARESHQISVAHAKSIAELEERFIKLEKFVIDTLSKIEKERQIISQNMKEIKNALTDFSSKLEDIEAAVRVCQIDTGKLEERINRIESKIKKNA